MKGLEGVELSQDPKRRNDTIRPVFWVFHTGVNVENGLEGGAEVGGRWPFGR